MAHMAQFKKTQANETGFDVAYMVRMGLLAGVVAAYVAVIGMVKVFSERELIAGLFTLGQVLLLAPPLGLGYYVARQKGAGLPGISLFSGFIMGIVSSVPPVLLIILEENVANIRTMFVNISPDLITVLTFNRENIYIGSLILLMVMGVSGLLGATLPLLPEQWRKAVVLGVAWTLGIGLMSELLINVLRPLLGTGFIRLIFQSGALRPFTALNIFLIAFAFSIFWQTQGGSIRTRYRKVVARRPKPVRYGSISVGGLLLLALPWIVGTFLTDVLDNIGLYILMGLGLNIAVGLAGLLDLGYLTNFAVGAYVAGVLTSTGQYGQANLSFWLVIPVALLAAMLTGFVLALPVLRMRGDYLAIATLGFGQIIGALALSDWLAPYIGGAQGILAIPNPAILGFSFSRPEHFYYIILVACLAMLFVSVRLNNSRTGRQWMALREDEDVAAAMGIDTTLTKLLAFTLSAAAGGVAGAIFAAKLGTVFPQSFNLLVSINVLSIIIVGGMGSIPGIVLGAFVLIGAPELLREFAEYRLLIYGALLIVVMLLRPEGLWPSATRRRELYDAMEANVDLTAPHTEAISHGQTAEADKMD